MVTFFYDSYDLQWPLSNLKIQFFNTVLEKIVRKKFKTCHLNDIFFTVLQITEKAMNQLHSTFIKQYPCSKKHPNWENFLSLFLDKGRVLNWLIVSLVTNKWNNYWLTVKDIVKNVLWVSVKICMARTMVEGNVQ